MKNTLMIALLLAAPMAMRGMEPVDSLESLKGAFNVNSDEALVQYLHDRLPEVKSVEDGVLIKALQHLGKENKLTELKLAAAPKRTADDATAAQGDANKISALQAAVSILQGVVAVVTDPNNQQQVQQAEAQLTKAGCKNCVIL